MKWVPLAVSELFNIAILGWGVYRGNPQAAREVIDLAQTRLNQTADLIDSAK